jgi:hypothetical protein
MHPINTATPEGLIREKAPEAWESQSRKNIASADRSVSDPSDFHSGDEESARERNLMSRDGAPWKAAMKAWGATVPKREILLSMESAASMRQTVKQCRPGRADGKRMAAVSLK